MLKRRKIMKYNGKEKGRGKGKEEKKEKNKKQFKKIYHERKKQKSIYLE